MPRLPIRERGESLRVVLKVTRDPGSPVLTPRVLETVSATVFLPVETQILTSLTRPHRPVPPRDRPSGLTRSEHGPATRWFRLPSPNCSPCPCLGRGPPSRLLPSQGLWSTCHQECLHGKHTPGPLFLCLLLPMDRGGSHSSGPPYTVIVPFCCHSLTSTVIVPFCSHSPPYTVIVPFCCHSPPLQ